jgi:hypothetical protein
MTDRLWLITLLASGLAFLAEGLLARYELMVYTVARRSRAAALPPEIPYARGADPSRPPLAYVVYLDGIGKRRFADTRDGGQLVKAIIAKAPELRILGQIQPYSPLASPLSGRPVWDWLKRHVGITLFLHNVMQTFVASDRRYRPLYNRAVSAQIGDQLRLAGYEPNSGVPVVLLCYSGAAQVASGAINELSSDLCAPLWLIMLGGFHNGANDLSCACHVYRLTSPNDWIEKVGAALFPQRWRLFRRSPWNKALDAGKITVHSLDPATHVGPKSYISRTARLADGRTYLDRTAETMVGMIRRDCMTKTHGLGTNNLR